MENVTKLALVGLALWAFAAPPASASDLPFPGGYAVDEDDDDAYEAVSPRYQRRVAVEDEVAPRVQRRIVERHIIERYVEEPAPRPVLRRQIAEPVLLPPLPIGPERYETRLRVQPMPPVTVVRPMEERRYVRPVMDYEPVRPSVQQRHLVRVAPPMEECRLVLNRRIDRFGYEQVSRTRVCD